MEKLLCPNLEEREAQITPEEALKVEALFFEKIWRQNLLTHIKRHGIPVSPTLLAEYRKGYFDFALRLEEAVAGCVAKYAGPRKRYCNARVNYKEQKVYWREMV